MGYLRHETLVVNHWDKERVEAAHGMALTIFGAIDDGVGADYAQLVSPVCPHVANGGAAFFVAPDGSKEGWETSRLAEEARAALILELRALSVDWALVLIGGDDGAFEVLASPASPHPTDLDTLLKEERAKNERLEEGIAYLRGIEQRNNELIDALLARAEAAEASALTARRDALEEAARESVALWMIQHSIATGHGDTLDDLLRELLASARRDGERDGLLKAKQIALAELRDWQAKDIEEGEAAAAPETSPTAQEPEASA